MGWIILSPHEGVKHMARTPSLSDWDTCLSLRLMLLPGPGARTPPWRKSPMVIHFYTGSMRFWKDFLKKCAFTERFPPSLRIGDMKKSCFEPCESRGSPDTPLHDDNREGPRAPSLFNLLTFTSPVGRLDSNHYALEILIPSTPVTNTITASFRAAHFPLTLN